MSEFRMKRVNEMIKRELSALIRHYLPVDDYGVVTVTDVSVAKDLKTAHIYISTIGTLQKNARPIPELLKIRKDLQRDLSKKVVLKYTPHLMFREDAGLERGQHLIDLLDSLDVSDKGAEDEDGQNT